MHCSLVSPNSVLLYNTTNLNEKSSNQLKNQINSAQQAQLKANAIATKLGRTGQTKRFNFQDHPPRMKLAVKHTTRKPMHGVQKLTITLKSENCKLCTAGAGTNVNQHTQTLLTALMASSVSCRTPDS